MEAVKSTHISDDGRERLRRAILVRRPWLTSTGPRTQEGKAKSRLNALRHGRFTFERRLWRRRARRFLRLSRLMRDAILGQQTVDDAEQVIAELDQLARCLAKAPYDRGADGEHKE